MHESKTETLRQNPPTSAEEREQIAIDARVQLSRVEPPVSEYERFAFFNTIPRLIAQVDALEAENRAFAADVLSLSSSLGKKIERVTELEDRLAAVLRTGPDAHGLDYAESIVPDEVHLRPPLLVWRLAHEALEQGDA